MMSLGARAFTPRPILLHDQEGEKDWERERRRRDREKKLGKHDEEDSDRAKHSRKRQWDEDWNEELPRRRK